MEPDPISDKNPKTRITEFNLGNNHILKINNFIEQENLDELREYLSKLNNGAICRYEFFDLAIKAFDNIELMEEIIKTAQSHYPSEQKCPRLISSFDFDLIKKTTYKLDPILNLIGFTYPLFFSDEEFFDLVKDLKPWQRYRIISAVVYMANFPNGILSWEALLAFAKLLQYGDFDPNDSNNIVETLAKKREKITLDNSFNKDNFINWFTKKNNEGIAQDLIYCVNHIIKKITMKDLQEFIKLNEKTPEKNQIKQLQILSDIFCYNLDKALTAANEQDKEQIEAKLHHIFKILTNKDGQFENHEAAYIIGKLFLEKLTSSPYFANVTKELSQCQNNCANNDKSLFIAGITKSLTNRNAYFNGQESLLMDLLDAFRKTYHTFQQQHVELNDDVKMLLTIGKIDGDIILNLKPKSYSRRNSKEFWNHRQSLNKIRKNPPSEDASEQLPALANTDDTKSERKNYHRTNPRKSCKKRPATKSPDNKSSEESSSSTPKSNSSSSPTPGSHTSSPRAKSPTSPRKKSLSNVSATKKS